MKTTLITLIIALRAVESSNGLDARAGGNDLQITPICVKDVNRIYHTDYKLADVTDRRRATEIAMLYMSYWGAKVSARPTAETYARVFHRGPKKWNDDAGARYWEKVKKHLPKGAK